MSIFGKVERLTEILVWIALLEVNVGNPYIGAVIERNHSVPPILRQ